MILGPRSNDARTLPPPPGVGVPGQKLAACCRETRRSANIDPKRQNWYKWTEMVVSLWFTLFLLCFLVGFWSCLHWISLSSLRHGTPEHLFLIHISLSQARYKQLKDCKGCVGQLHSVTVFAKSTSHVLHFYVLMLAADGTWPGAAVRLARSKS